MDSRWAADAAEMSATSPLVGEGTCVAERLGCATRGRRKSSCVSGLDQREGSAREKYQEGRGLEFRSGHVELEFVPRGQAEGVLSHWV